MQYIDAPVLVKPTVVDTYINGAQYTILCSTAIDTRLQQLIVRIVTLIDC